MKLVGNSTHLCSVSEAELYSGDERITVIDKGARVYAGLARRDQFIISMRVDTFVGFRKLFALGYRFSTKGPCPT